MRRFIGASAIAVSAMRQFAQQQVRGGQHQVRLRRQVGPGIIEAQRPRQSRRRRHASLGGPRKAKKLKHVQSASGREAQPLRDQGPGAQHHRLARQRQMGVAARKRLLRRGRSTQNPAARPHAQAPQRQCRRTIVPCFAAHGASIGEARQAVTAGNKRPRRKVALPLPARPAYLP
ncbi:MAG: hypothetical protein D6782_00325 [Alphaproteobacteria bacterium]|nr:MAG: hypothetical protein D6782_00325 [Alphaproteobacteria bacterium]